MLDRAMVRDRLNIVFAEVFDLDDIVIHDGMTARDVEGWDSLAHITLILATEREFKMKLSAAEVGALKNVGQLIDIIVARAPRAQG